MKPPFPYYGGKRRVAAEVWRRFGTPAVYVEPFAGGLAVLLHREEPAKREVICDTDGMLCNFWRAVRDDPEQVAFYADYPTIHQDLTARHRWLIKWGAEHSHKLEDDPNWYEPKAAGWWVWGISNWIGGEWCKATSDRRPYVQTGGNGRGVQVGAGRPHRYATAYSHRGQWPRCSDKRKATAHRRPPARCSDRNAATR